MGFDTHRNLSYLNRETEVADKCSRIFTGALNARPLVLVCSFIYFQENELLV